MKRQDTIHALEMELRGLNSELYNKHIEHSRMIMQIGEIETLRAELQLRLNDLLSPIGGDNAQPQKDRPVGLVED